MRIRKVAAMFAAGVAMIGGQALADDLMLSKSDATDLIQSDVGRPFWQMEAQCAGIFGAGYAFQVEHKHQKEADRAKDDGISMLNEAIARLQADRGLDQPAALNLAAVEVETGRSVAKDSLQRDGAGPTSSYNFMRSACYDISAAQRKHFPR